MKQPLQLLQLFLTFEHQAFSQLSIIHELNFIFCKSSMVFDITLCIWNCKELKIHLAQQHNFISNTISCFYYPKKLKDTKQMCDETHTCVDNLYWNVAIGKVQFVSFISFF